MNRLWQPGLEFGIPVVNMTFGNRLVSRSNLPSGPFRVGRIDCRRSSSDSIGINTLPTFGLEEWRIALPVKTWLSIGNDGVVALEGRLPVSWTSIGLGSVVLLWFGFRAPLVPVAVSLVFVSLFYAGARQSRWSGNRVFEFLSERVENA
jgi:hypothetical protein